MKSKERRDAKRFPIRVLVKCVPPASVAKRDPSVVEGWEMWARDIGNDGVGLQWSRQWVVQRCPKCSPPLTRRAAKSKASLCLCSSPGARLKKGQEVLLDGLIYTENGSEPIKGLIQWVRPGKTVYEVGVKITSPNHRDFFRALEDS